MPVSIDEFESGELPREMSVAEQVITYLYTHRDKASTRSEIAAGIDEDANAVGTALSRLKNRDIVRHKTGYWALTDDIDRVRASYDLHAMTERLDAAEGSVDSEEWDAAAPDAPHPSESTGDNEE